MRAYFALTLRTCQEQIIKSALMGQAKSAYLGGRKMLMVDRRYILISGEAFARLAEDSLLSQDAFANKIRVKRASITRLVRPGIHRVLRDTFTEMASGLNMTPEQLQKKIGAGILLTANYEAMLAALRQLAELPSPRQYETAKELPRSTLVSLAEFFDAARERTPEITVEEVAKSIEALDEQDKPIRMPPAKKPEHKGRRKGA